ncbi:MAG TPA: thiamine phosphate synthase [Persephonella sp.]|uniref:Thiamine-phosphate synthase n=2 Tax=Hydrogenothermaceae TaxID=224027 RepID=THIE_PERMH|nr:RecName: Full=Thiamine-phosphate synthase; Short=TP synthase; Short=TPS; AltName: Full=Thiamine-phosphate pyrophosphorylase; Short=TMP pyrophosphorylase; Short=TMP-PPase [Persephonella marina EX-H1]ACO04508.1 thiamine-phosphate pyrophosphorylase [Persephonella marina EX-H1]HCB68925.1 thiamine phosphate synthase [Persephonella sp.]
MERMDLSLYVITDEKLLEGKDIYSCIEQAISGGATVIQYRAKNKSSKKMYEEAVVIKKVCRKYDIPFIVNDRIDIAIAVDADGVHLGQDDLDVEVARRILGFEKIIGLSTKKIEDVIKANSLPVDYIGFGSVFPTSTKEDAVYAGLEKLKEVMKISVQPVVAIGGINEKNLTDLLKTGCRNVAVVSAVFKDDNIKENTERLKNIMENFT